MFIPLFTRPDFVAALAVLGIGGHIRFPAPCAADLAWLRSRLNADRRAHGRRYATSTDRLGGIVTVTRVPADATAVECRHAINLPIPARLLRMQPGEVQFIPGVLVTSVRVAASALHAENPTIRYRAHRMTTRAAEGVAVSCASTTPPVEPKKTRVPHRWRGLVAIIGTDAVHAASACTSTLPSRVIATIHAKAADSAVVAVYAPNRATVAYWQGQIAGRARAQGGATQTDTVRSVLHASS